MVDRENREDRKRERSLLALGQAVRGEDEAQASLVSIGDRANPSWREDAATRHRIARTRREARTNPSLAATPDTAQSRAGREPVSAARTLPEADRTWPETDKTWPEEADEPVREGYTQARGEPVAAAHPEAYRSHTGGAHPSGYPSSREGAEGQEWKPLIDPMLVVRGVVRSKPLIVATTILGAGLGIAIALSTPKKYEATTELVIEPGDLKLSDRDLTQPVGQPDAALAVVETRIKMMTSGKVLDRVVKDLDLVNDPEFNGQGSGGLGVMSLIRSILSRQDGPVEADDIRRQALAVGNLAESLSVERAGKTFVISLSATTQDAKRSAEIANKTREVFEEETARYQSDMAGRATNELTSKLDELRKSVEAAERKVEDFRATHDLVDAQGHLISDDQMLKLNEQLSVARARTLELNARAASARSVDINSVLTGTLPEEINSNTMSDLRSQYATLKQDADRAAVRLGPRHPELQALDAQLAGARERIAAELRRIASSLQVDLKRSVQLEQDLASRLAQAKVQSGNVNSDLVTMRELERDATAKRSVYEQYLLRAKETGEQKNINTANINLLTTAQPPLEPNGPSRALVALAGLLLGLASGVGIGAMRGAYESLRETANSRSRRKTDGRRFDDRSYQAQPAVPPVEAARTQRSGPINALLSAMRRLMPGKTAERAPDENSATMRSSGSISAAITEGRKPMQAAGYNPPQFQQGDYAPQPQTAVQPPYPTMPQQMMYPASHMQAYPYAQQPMGYPQTEPWPMQPLPAELARRQPFHAAQQPYPQQAAPLRPSAYPKTSSDEAHSASQDVEQQTPIEEIRASLREFREAVRELTESRTHRRYF